MCMDDATDYNHCSWCGATFQKRAQLSKHLDSTDCAREIDAAVSDFWSLPRILPGR